MKSARCRGRSSSNTVCRADSGSGARITRSIRDAPVTEEHVLGPAQPDPLRRRSPGRFAASASIVGIGPDRQFPPAVGVGEQPVDGPDEVGDLRTLTFFVAASNPSVR